MPSLRNDGRQCEGTAPGSWQRLNLAAAMSATVWVSHSGHVKVLFTGGYPTVIRF